MSHPMFEYGVCYGQSMTSTDVQQQSTTLVQIGQAVPPNNPPPGFSIVAHVRVEVPSTTMESPDGTPSRMPSKNSKKAGYSELLFGA